LNNSTKKKKVTIICGMSVGGDFNRAIEIGSMLKEAGFSPTVIVWNRLKKKVENRFNNMPVIYFNLPVQSSHFIRMFISYFRWWLFVLKELLLSSPPDYVHVQGFFNAPPAILAAKIKGELKVVYDLIDYAADSFDWRSLTRRLVSYLENLYISVSEGVVVVDRDKQDLSKMNIKRLVEIPNFPEDRYEELTKKFKKSPNKFIIYYGGIIMETRGLYQVSKAIENLNDVEFIIAGPTENKDISEYKIINKENVNYIGVISKEESLKWTFKAHLIPIFYDPKIEINRKACPAKLYDAMMCGTPVLINKEASKAANIVREEKCGLVVPYNDIKKIRKCIIKLKENRKLREELGINGRRAYLLKYNKTVIKTRLLKLYEEMEKG